jgi:cation diffusion facilitator family transporter
VSIFHLHSRPAHLSVPDEDAGASRVFVGSFLILGLTAVLEIGISSVSGSVSLLSDAVHNVSDALTGVPLWVAFFFSRKKPTARYSYGYGKFEDLAGVMIVVLVLLSSVFSITRSFGKLLHPQIFLHPGWVALASVTGFLGNEAVAFLRIRAGRRTGSVSLVADGQHARVDGLVSLSVLAGVAGSLTGHLRWDPLVGILLGVVTFLIGVRMGWMVGTHLSDGIDSGVLETIRRAALDEPGIREVSRVRARWMGHRMICDLLVVLDHPVSLPDSRQRARAVEERIRKALPFMDDVLVVATPYGEGDGNSPLSKNVRSEDQEPGKNETHQ